MNQRSSDHEQVSLPSTVPALIQQERAAEVRMATSDADRERIFQFRYAIYIDEMRRTQRYADPDRRRIEEPFDATAHLVIAEHEGEVVGTVRANFGGETDLGYYGELFRMSEVGAAYPSRVSLTTKFMVAPAFRSGTLAVRIAACIFDFGCGRGIQHDFLDCNAHLEEFFGRLGYVKHMPKVVHPEYGLVQPMRLDLADEEHLRRVGSPFRRCKSMRARAVLR